MASKEEIRKRCRARKIANPLYRSRIINKTLLPLLSNSRRILIYHPLPGEVDINPLIKKLRREGKELYFPVVEGEELRMVKYGLPLEKVRWGWAPARKTPRREKIDVAIVPIIGTDSTLRRIGFGKGFYDRFFQKLGYRPRIIFLQLSPCIYRDVVTDSW
ncbi:MAG: 5-formyltetrahydrofolate cyclo-ligase, partial [Campylobacterales bacterium]